jgi:hypothetical protein
MSEAIDEDFSADQTTISSSSTDDVLPSTPAKVAHDEGHSYLVVLDNTLEQNGVVDLPLATDNDDDDDDDSDDDASDEDDKKNVRMIDMAQFDTPDKRMFGGGAEDLDKRTKVLLFKCAGGVEEARLDVEMDAIAALRDMLNCTALESMPLSYGYILFFDKHGAENDKERNTAIDKYSPPNYVDFRGDVVLASSDMYDDDDAPAEWKDVTLQELDQLREALTIEKRSHDLLDGMMQMMGRALIGQAAE